MGLPDPMLGLGDPFSFPPGGGSPPPGMGLFTGTDLTPQGDKSLGVLKGWSSLAGDPRGAPSRQDAGRRLRYLRCLPEGG
jgi:hypothetical protein